MDNFMGKQRAADLYRIPLALSDGTLTDFSQFRGKVVLVVNVAARFCQRNFGMTFPFTLKADVRARTGTRFTWSSPGSGPDCCQGC